jgi:uncharacterized protein
MELQQQIEQELKQAMREKNEIMLSAIRMLLTAMKVKEKEIKRQLDESEIRQVISSQIKQRRDSVEQYKQARREDLATREEEEIKVLQAFLPEALSPEVLESIIDEVVAEVGAESVKEMGKVMKALMPRIEGRAEGKTVNELVRKKLQA